MGRRRWGWVGAGYLAGTIQFAYVVARVRDAQRVMAAASGDASERDAHVLLAAHAGSGAAAAAIIGDLAKAALVAIAADRSGLEPAWKAATGVAVVAGHAFPFYARPFAARGITAASGVTLVFLPWPMVVAGSILLAGKALGHTGPASTLGFAAVPVVAALQGKPRALVAMGGAVFGLILARRMVGIRAVAARDGWPQALLRRLLFDADRPTELVPSATHVA
ncbi:MAG: glycerol-3-phosphate acyltransferase [Actinomycetota bacterium]